jgi:hypothetical protein
VGTDGADEPEQRDLQERERRKAWFLGLPKQKALQAYLALLIDEWHGLDSTPGHVPVLTRERAGQLLRQQGISCADDELLCCKDSIRRACAARTLGRASASGRGETPTGDRRSCRPETAANAGLVFIPQSCFSER